MPYKFNFDLSRVSQSFFRRLARDAYEKGIHRRVGRNVRYLAERLKVRELTGLDISDATVLVEDLVGVHVMNLLDREKFLKTKKRVLFLPHCARKYMDGRCQARFDPTGPSYYCAHCSPDCLINRATTLGEERGYDVYVLPGGVLRAQNTEGKLVRGSCRGRVHSGTEGGGRVP